jgi:hypothetical protein
MSDRIWFQKKDLEKILEIINKFPVQEENYQLEYTNTPGLGYCLNLIMKCETNGVIGELKVPIAGVEDW